MILCVLQRMGVMSGWVHLMLLGLLWMPLVGQAARLVCSPDGRLACRLAVEDGAPGYRVVLDGEALIDFSGLGISVVGHSVEWLLGEGVVEAHDSVWSPVWGKRIEVRDRYNELRVPLSDSDGAFGVLVVFRVYDEGVAFRYELTGLGALTVESDLSAFNFCEDATAWSYNGERANAGPELVSSVKGRRRLPMTLKMGTKRYVALAEADLDRFGWMDVERSELGLRAYVEPTEVSLPFSLPWRVVMVGSSPGDLVDSDLLENLNPPCAIADASWVKPGLTLWDWRTWGYTAPDGFEYGLDMASWRRFIDFASVNEVPYLLLDANWYGPEHNTKSNPVVSRDHLVEQLPTGRITRKPAPADWADPIDIPALITYAKARGVGIFLYINDQARVNYDFDETLATYRKWGAAGIKYGFMRAKNRLKKVNKTQEIISLCAKHELMCNFHDGPIPDYGHYRTWPNCTTREYCHAQADAKSSFTPRTFCTSVFVNMLAGPVDMNNGLFALNKAHENRPRIFQPIDSTIVGECARTLVAFSGQAIVLDAPEAFAAHPRLLGVLAAQKQPWLESRTLSGAIGEQITMMRRNESGWFIGSACNEAGATIEIALDFLPAGKTYEATLYRDTEETHFQQNKEAYAVESRLVSSADTISARLAPGGGFCMKIVEP